MILAAVMIIVAVPDDVSADAEGWARKAKPVAECATAVDCDRKWSTATEWVRKNSKFQIAVDRPDLFSTYGAIYPSLDLALTLVRKDAGNGKEQISLRAWCGNAFGCSPKPKNALASLQRTLAAL